MNRLKNWCQLNDNLNLLTYADDTAIGYFQRQGIKTRFFSKTISHCHIFISSDLLILLGFSADIEMDVKDWDIGFLKYYDSATLMHCLVDSRISKFSFLFCFLLRNVPNNLDYLEINHQIRLQRATFCKKMRQLSLQHIEYDGIKRANERGPV